MKVLAIVLLCAFAAVQGRSAVKVVDNRSTELELVRHQPWLVHCRYAVRTNGNLQTLLGSLISDRWVITSSNIFDASFIWIRFGLIYVPRPSLVYESSAVRAQRDVGLINLNRDIPLSYSLSIAPIGLVQWSGPINGLSCGFGLSAIGGPGEHLQCSEIALEESDGNLIGSGANHTQFDLGTALVKDDAQYGVLIAVDESSAKFAIIDDALKSWIQAETGVEVTPKPKPDSSESNSSSSESNSSSSESNSSSSESEEDSRVKFVNF